MSTTHVLKCLPEYWDRLADGSKTFEVRYNDRGFRAGDVLEIHRLAKTDGDRVPPPLLRRVIYVMQGGAGIGHQGRPLVDASAVIMSVVPINAKSADRAMVEHLTQTLDAVREMLILESDPTAGGLSVKMVAHLISHITEALDDGDDHAE